MTKDAATIVMERYALLSRMSEASSTWMRRAAGSSISSKGNKEERGGVYSAG